MKKKFTPAACVATVPIRRPTAAKQIEYELIDDEATTTDVPPLPGEIPRASSWPPSRRSTSAIRDILLRYDAPPQVVFPGQAPPQFVSRQNCFQRSRPAWRRPL